MNSSSTSQATTPARSNLIARYTHWLHGKWPAGLVENLPEAQPDGSTNLSGVYVVGDLTGIPLLKFSSDTGAKAVKTILADSSFANRNTSSEVLDIAIIGGGVSGMAAAMEAASEGLNAQVFEASQAFSTIENFPVGKPIYTYPTDLTPAGAIQFTDRSDTKEGLLDELGDITEGVSTVQRTATQIEADGSLLKVQFVEGDPIQAHRVIVAIGRSGNYRKLDVPGEDLPKVSNRLHDPKSSKGKRVLVVGGGDSALETAIATVEAGAEVTLSYRKSELSRAKPANIETIQRMAEANQVSLLLPSNVTAIEADSVTLDQSGEEKKLPNDQVFSMIGREAPLDFFRRSGMKISGEWSRSTRISFVAFFAFCVWLYHWKGVGFTSGLINPGKLMGALLPAERFGAGHLLGVIRDSFSAPWVWYTLAYCLCVVIFGIRRIKRRKTPYVTWQTLSLMFFQVVPLFLLPCIFLPWAYHNGMMNDGFGGWLMTTFFPSGPSDFWRAFGFVLAWPLMAWNLFTSEPIWGWVILSFIQTFVIIPIIVIKYGKGAYCGWICSCGALAETMGDTHRHKMPHGPKWNKVNMIGQVILLFSLIILVVRVVSWFAPGSGMAAAASGMEKVFKYGVDLWLAGIIGVGLYFHFSGRVWCRFACPLAALMHIYARFSKFRIFSDKNKCISCNVCTSVCHQGIDVMNFANKGAPMEDPECVRCSACVQSCPTGVLSFGEVNRRTGEPLKFDRLPASPIQMKEVLAEKE